MWVKFKQKNKVPILLAIYWINEVNIVWITSGKLINPGLKLNKNQKPFVREVCLGVIAEPKQPEVCHKLLFLANFQNVFLSHWCTYTGIQHIGTKLLLSQTEWYYSYFNLMLSSKDIVENSQLKQLYISLRCILEIMICS